MKPTLLSFHLPVLGEVVFHSYVVMMALGFLLGTLLPIRANYRRKHPFPATPMGGLCVFGGALFGARAYYILVLDKKPIWHIYEALLLYQGGLVFYGGLIGGFFGGWAYLRYCKIPLIPAGDIAFTYLPLAHAFGRMGCFLNGCCWGAACPTWLPWGITYKHSAYGAFHQQVEDHLISPDAKCTLPMHPTQAYEMLGLLIIFVIMLYVYKHRRYVGTVFFLYPLLYGILRFTNEFMRGDSSHPFLGLTVAQGISLGLMAIGVTGLLISRTGYWQHLDPDLAPETDVAVEEEVAASTDIGDDTEQGK